MNQKVDPRPAAQARRSKTLTGDAATDRMVEEQRVREQRRIDQQRAQVEQASHGLPVYAPTEMERLAAEQGAAEAASGAREAERSRMNATAVDRPASSTQRAVEAGRPAVGQTVDPLTEPLRGMS